jgi:hypothetical protein
MKHKLIWAGVIGVALGMYLGGANSGTGIYGTFVGQTAANLWSAGNIAGGGQG